MYQESPITYSKSGTQNYTYCQPLIFSPNPLAPHLDSVIQQIVTKYGADFLYKGDADRI